ncbi:MAG: alpha/beta hydrolase [Acidimicrobiales bacterium]|nr:alpha/beta hydrolase [Acidimicrobiales bacterium]
MVELRVSVREAESANPPIVFTHGWIDDHTVWDGVRAELDDRTTIAWDLRGHGRSEAPPPGEYSRELLLDDMRSVVETAGQPVVLAGHSLGGYLGLAFALLHPDLVAGLVLIAAGPGFRNPEARDQWNAAVDASAAKLHLPPGSEEASKHVDSWVIDELETIEVPVVAVVGERDKRFQASLGLFEKKLNVVHSAVVPDAGHSVHRKHPAAVAAAIRHLDR